MKFHEKTSKNLKFLEDCWSSLGSLKRFPKLEKSIFRDFGISKIEKIDPKPHPHPILGASRGVTALQ